MKILRQNRSAWALLVVIVIIVGWLLVLLTHRDSVMVTTNRVNLRTGPAITYTTARTAKRGARLTILDRKNNWYQVENSDGKTGWVASWLVDPANPVKRAGKLSEATIVLDPGHGGSDSGALSISKKQEKTYTLATAKKVAQKLRDKGVHVIMTRDSDKTVSLGARPQMAADNQADAFISFHFDSSPHDNQGSGTTTYYYHDNSSLTLAKALNHQLTALPLMNRGVQFGNFEVIRDNAWPAVLLELGYINSKHDFNQISSSQYQTKIANEVTDGLTQYINDRAKN